jgi:glutamyl-tRNA synthetase
LFAPVDEIPESFDKSDVRSVLDAFESSYDETVEQSEWFNNIKAIAEKCGFCPDMKQYKADPSAFKGSVADVSMFLRVAVTGRMNSPDLYEVMRILGKERVLSRVSK